MTTLQMLAARAVAHCPRDLAEALCRELDIPMPEGFVDKPDALAGWLPDPGVARCEKHKGTPWGRQTWAGTRWSSCMHCEREAASK